MDWFIYFIVAIIAFWVGWHVRAISILSRLAENPEHFISILNQIKKINEEEQLELKPKNPEGTELKIERVGNQLYAYDKETNEFIAQGSDLQSLLDTANARYPNDKFFGYIPADSSAKELAVKN